MLPRRTQAILGAPRLRPAVLLAVTLLWVIATASGVTAQEGEEAAAVFDEQIFGGQIEVGLVGVDVWVTDAEGEPVYGLGADDFTLRHRGDPVVPTHFSEVRSGRVVVEAPPSAAEDAAGSGEEGSGEAGSGEEGSGEEGAAPALRDDAIPPGHLIVYFDQLRLSPTSYQAVGEALERVLADADVPAERILVLRQDEGLHLEVPFGAGAADVRAAVERITAGSHRGLARASEVQQAREAVLAVWEEAESLSGSASQGMNVAEQSAAAAGPGGGGATSFGSGPRGAVESRLGGSASPPACDLFVQRVEPVLNGWTRDRTSRLAGTLSNLDAAAGLVSGLPGPKALLYVSDGLDVTPGMALAAYAADFCPQLGRQRELEALGEGLNLDFQRLAAHMNAHGITVHAIQASGLRGIREGAASQRATRGSQGAGVRFEARQRQGERSGMSLLAAETGGRAVFNRGNLAPEVAAMGRELGDYYSLAFPPPEGSGPVHRVEVAVDDPDLRVRYRRSVRSPDPAERVEEGLTGALHLSITSNPHDLSLGLAGAGGEGAPLSLLVMVPLDRLVFSAGGEAGGDGAAAGEKLARVELRALAQAAEGATEAVPRSPVSLSQEFRLRQPAGAGGEVASQRANLPLALPLPPGPHRLAVALVDLSSGETSFVSTALTVPGEAEPAAGEGAAGEPPG